MLSKPANVQKLPHDLLHEILSIVAPPDLCLSLDVLPLTHVCRDWRSVLVHAPFFWTEVEVSAKSATRPHNEVIADLLARSKTQLVTFNVVVDNGTIHPNTLRIISLHAHRFRNLNVVGKDRGAFFAVLSQLLCHYMPKLESIDFLVTGEPDSYGEAFNAELAPVAEPRFRPNHISHWERPMSHIDWSIRSHTITNLSLKYIRILPVDLLPILIQSQSTLQTLELYILHTLEPTVPQVRGVQLIMPNLRILELGYQLPHALTEFARMIDAPGLDTLRVHDYGGCPDYLTPLALRERPPTAELRDIAPLLDALSQQYAGITSLELRGVMCLRVSELAIVTSLVPLLGNLRSLSLVLCHQAFVHTVFKADSMIHGPETFLRQLTVTAEDSYSLTGFFVTRLVDRCPDFDLLVVNPRVYPDMASSTFAGRVEVLTVDECSVPDGFYW